MFEQSRDVALDLFELVQMQGRVNDGEHVSALRLFVNENPLPIAHDLLLHLENAFPLQHHGENECRRDVMRIVLLDEFSQKRLRGFLFDRFRRRRRRLIDALPIGDETLSIARAFAELLLPARSANIRPAECGFLIEKQRMIRLFVGERFAASLAAVAARLNVPLGYQALRT